MIKTDEDSKMKVILASKSPRRKEIFGAYAKECGFSFEIITRETDEELFGEHPVTGVKTLAERKGAATAPTMASARARAGFARFFMLCIHYTIFAAFRVGF